MLKRFKKNKITTIKEQPPIVVSIFDPNSGDTTETALSLAKKWMGVTQKKAVIIEFPCLGLPRLLSRIEDPDTILKEQSVDQYLLDMDRGDVKTLDTYITTVEGVDCVAAHPKTSADIPVLIKMENLKTALQAPEQLAQGLLGTYDLVIYALQGQLFHPMSFGALRHADSVIVQVQSLVALPHSYKTLKKLPTYGVEDQVILYSDFQLALPEKVWKKDELTSFICNLDKKVISKISDQKPTTFSQHIGVINPAEHIAYQSSLQGGNGVSLNIRESEQLKRLVDQTRQVLKSQHADEFIESFTNIQKRGIIQHHIADYIREQTTYKFTASIDVIIQKVQTEITQMGPLQVALDDPNTSSIEINGPDEVMSEINHVDQLDTRVKFEDKEHIYAIINKMLIPMGKTLTANDPVLDSQYGGFRINVVADRDRGGLTSDFPVVSIRKFPPDVYTSEACIAYGNISEEIDEFNADIYPLGVNEITGGSVNAGKTAGLQRIPLYLNPLTRILTIEDSEEMMLKKKEAYLNYPNIVSFFVKEHEIERRRYDIAKITKITLRQNPDWVIIGEVRDHAAARQALEAANTGSNVTFTIHANDAKMTVVRFFQLAGNTPDIASQVGDSIDLVRYNVNDFGIRRQSEIAELLGFDERNQPILNPIFVYNFKTKLFERVGSLKNMRNKMIRNGASQAVIDRWCEPLKEEAV
ncbi:putative conjugal transfer protein [compost metagenome]